MVISQVPKAALPPGSNFSMLRIIFRKVSCVRSSESVLAIVVFRRKPET